MKASYSKMIIFDQVVPDTDAAELTTAMSLAMVSILGSFERSARHWRELLESEGLVVTGIWSSPLITEHVLEAEMV